MPKSPQEPSYRLTPADTPKSASVQDTAGSLGLHDTLKHGPRSLATEAASSSSSAVHARLQIVCASSDSQSYDADCGGLPQWEETQDNLKLTLQRNLHGLHAPMRLLMSARLSAL
jgi:proteasome maturation protein